MSGNWITIVYKLFIGKNTRMVSPRRKWLFDSANQSMSIISLRTYHDLSRWPAGRTPVHRPSLIYYVSKSSYYLCNNIKKYTSDLSKSKSLTLCLTRIETAEKRLMSWILLHLIYWLKILALQYYGDMPSCLVNILCKRT